MDAHTWDTERSRSYRRALGGIVDAALKQLDHSSMLRMVVMTDAFEVPDVREIPMSPRRVVRQCAPTAYSTIKTRIRKLQTENPESFKRIFGQEMPIEVAINKACRSLLHGIAPRVEQQRAIRPAERRFHRNVLRMTVALRYIEAAGGPEALAHSLVRTVCLSQNAEQGLALLAMEHGNPSLAWHPWSVFTQQYANRRADEPGQTPLHTVLKHMSPKAAEAVKFELGLLDASQASIHSGVLQEVLDTIRGEVLRAAPPLAKEAARAYGLDSYDLACIAYADENKPALAS